MDVAHQFQEVFFLIADYGFVSILEKVTGAIVPEIECHGITGEKSPHEFRERDIFHPQEKMEVGRQKCPGKAVGSR